MLLFKNWRSQRVPCIHAGATKTTLERSARMDSWVGAAVQNKWTTTVRLIMDCLWICNSPQSLVLYQQLNTVLSNLSNQFNHVSTGAVIMANSKIYKITSACYTALPRPELHRGSPWDYNLYRFLRDQRHPLQLVWEQAVTSQASWGLEVLFGFRGGARRGGVSWKLSCCWKTGTFPHESQTLFSLNFTRGKKKALQMEKRPRQPWVTAARGQQSATFKGRGKRQASRAPVRFNSQCVISSQKNRGWCWSHMLKN